jgi:hypothetical protein
MRWRRIGTRWPDRINCSGAVDDTLAVFPQIHAFIYKRVDGHTVALALFFAIAYPILRVFIDRSALGPAAR